MSDMVPADEIEGIVGASRHETVHLGRAVTSEQTVYVLHSQRCLNTTSDLRTCRFSLALDRGIDIDGAWRDHQNKPVVLGVWNGRLIPIGAKP